MAIMLKVKFDPQRGGAQQYDFITPGLRVNDWSDAVFSVLESADDINYVTLEEGTDWRADIDWPNSRIRIHILKDYSSVVYLALASASARNIAAAYSIQGPRKLNMPAAFNIEGPCRRLIPVAWNTGAAKVRNIAAAYDIYGERMLNIPAGFYHKDIRSRNIPVGYGISGAVGRLINVAFHIGTSDAKLVTAGAWIMGVARLPSEATIIPPDCDPAASRVKGRTKQITLAGTQWEELD